MERTIDMDRVTIEKMSFFTPKIIYFINKFNVPVLIIMGY